MSEPKKHVLKLRKVSKYSYSVILPKEIIQKYEWKKHQKVTVEDKGNGKVVIRDWRER